MRENFEPPLLVVANHRPGTNLAPSPRVHTPLVGPLPTRGLWSAVGLTRGQFFAILALSVLCFILAGGPVWAHARESHFARIVISYAIVLPTVALVLRRERPFPLGRVLAASALIALVKLVVTALLLASLVLAT